MPWRAKVSLQPMSPAISTRVPLGGADMPRRYLPDSQPPRIAKLTGTEAEHWLNLQQMYDLRVAERELAAALKQIPRRETRAA